MRIITIATLVLLINTSATFDIFLPVNTPDRKSLNSIQLTTIGHFGIMRKARPNIPEHYHTGIDIKRPRANYKNEYIFPIAEGIVISMRNDGPYAQIIIEHQLDNKTFWTVYEHIAGIKVTVNNKVSAQEPIARFMDRNELDTYGWQFDHFHLEILKIKPMKLKPGNKNPQRFYNSFSLICYTKADLEKYFYNPVSFLNQNLN